MQPEIDTEASFTTTSQIEPEETNDVEKQTELHQRLPANRRTIYTMLFCCFADQVNLSSTSPNLPIMVRSDAHED
eukprot:13189025-Ditylum_brightwellii.AAC.1